MANSKKLITKVSRLHNAKQLIESVTEPANTAYYTFIGNHLEYANTSDIPQPNDTIYETHIDVYRNMIFGKRITQNDLSLMIVRNDYVSNKVYSMYDDRAGEANIEFFDSNYYAIVNAGSFYHVFKVLDNNGGSNSTVQPEFSEVDVNDEVYQTSDGYVWKYMYSADDTTVRKFATSDYFPVVPNTEVSSAAKEGVINVIKVENGGRGYDNYCNGTFRTEDLKIGGNGLVYSINSSTTANTISKYYNGCYIYIAAGTGAGQYSKITNYAVNSTAKAIYLQNEFATPPLADSVFEIYPGVDVIGDGTESVKAVARAIVNSAGNTIQRIEMLNLGAGYKYATATVNVDDVVGVSNSAIIRPVYSPPGGHGYDAAAELGATRVCVSTKFSNSDVGIPLRNEYRTVGLLKDPQFSNVIISVSNTTGSFVADETIYKVDSIRISDNATITTANATITADSDFNRQLTAGEFIYLQTDSGYQLAVVNSVVNSSQITLTQNSYYSCTATAIYKTNISTTQKMTEAHVTSVAVGSIVVSNVNGTFKTGDFIIGDRSGAVADVSTIMRNGTAKNFDTFVQMYKYSATSAAGEFIPDELVFQSDTGLFADQFANAYLHSVVTNEDSVDYYVTNQIGVFNINEQIVGSNSAATAEIVNKYSPELEFGSGEVMYIEKIDAIDRSNTASETIKFIFEF